MGEASVTTLPDARVESLKDTSAAWSILDEVQGHQKTQSDILAMPERLNEVPEWLRTPLRRFLRLKQRNWPAKTVKKINQTALQPPEPYDILLHPAL